MADDVPSAPEQNGRASDPQHRNDNSRHMSLLWFCHQTIPKMHSWFRTLAFAERRAGSRVGFLAMPDPIPDPA